MIACGGAIHLRAILLLFLATHSISAQDPEPFRGQDEIDGRDFEYKKESFLQRFSYRFPPAREREWQRDRQGFRMTAGSITSDELYLIEELRERVTLDGPLFFTFRQKRDEDFDSRFDRVLTGLGAELFESGWEGAILGDLLPEKEEIDAHLELTWKASGGSRLRLAAVAADVGFNGKADEAHYERRPWTWFAEGRWALPVGGSVGGWVNYNPNLRREESTRGFDFTYRQLSGGACLRFPGEEEPWHITAAVEALVSRRGRHRFAPGSTDERRFTRRHLETDLSIERRLVEPLEVLWLGTRYFRLLERDHRPLEPTEESNLVRREWFLHGGLVWRWSDTLSLSPEVILDRVDNRESFPFDPVRSARDEAWVGKLNLPLNVTFPRATLTVNPTFRLHRLAFGGGSVQLEVAF